MTEISHTFLTSDDCAGLPTGVRCPFRFHALVVTPLRFAGGGCLPFWPPKGGLSPFGFPLMTPHRFCKVASGPEGSWKWREKPHEDSKWVL
jgi:hypothetical protein